MGIQRQSVVAVNVPDVIFHVALTLALIRLGAITLSVRDGEASSPIKIDALVTTTNQPSVPAGRVILADPSWIEGDGRPLERHYLPQTHEDDLCRIILTSGTIGEPKAVAISHRLLASRMSRHITVFGNRLGNCSRIYTDVPISSSVGFQFLVYALWRGGTAFFPGDDFDRTFRVFEDYKVQCLVGSPGGFENLVKWFSSGPAYQSNIEAVFCGGDLLSRSLSERIRSQICSHVIAGYGSTEASMSAIAHAHEIAEIPQAVGFVTPGVAIQIVNSMGDVLPSEQEGEIRIKSEYAVDGYLGNPEASSASFRNGWFYPGDIGTLRDDGLLVVSGREQSMLNLGGDKINPEALELLLKQFPGVQDAAVVGLPNAYGNKEVHAFVVSQTPLSSEQLDAYCQARISRAFWPKMFYSVASIPRNEMGKVDRRRLPELADQGKSLGN